MNKNEFKKELIEHFKYAQKDAKAQGFNDTEVPIILQSDVLYEEALELDFPVMLDSITGIHYSDIGLERIIKKIRRW